MESIVKLLIVIPFLLSFLCTGSGKESECQKRLGNFSEYQEQYVQCAIKYGQPVELCEKCAKKYILANNAYKLLSDPDCYMHYFDLDRLNIINSIFLHGKSIWDKAHCTDCYDWKDGEINLNLSADALTFMELMNNTIDCINAHYGTECEDCPSEYKKLNLLYGQMETKKEHKICYDLQDKMNKTRLRWSKDLRCCKERKSSMFGFTLLSGFFSLLAVAFYCIVPSITIRAEQHSYLTDSPAPSSLENVATTSSQQRRNVDSPPKSRKIRTIEDDLDDDPILSTSPSTSNNMPGPSSSNRLQSNSKSKGSVNSEPLIDI